jgi:hypothetical protein
MAAPRERGGPQGVEQGFPFIRPLIYLSNP